MFCKLCEDRFFDELRQVRKVWYGAIVAQGVAIQGGLLQKRSDNGILWGRGEKAGFTMSVIGPVRTDKHFFSRWVGNGSSGHDFVSRDSTSLRTSPVDTVLSRNISFSSCCWRKDCSDSAWQGEADAAARSRFDRIAEIFDAKKSLRSSTTSCEQGRSGRICGAV
jgi:hypothetical protein